MHPIIKYYLATASFFIVALGHSQTSKTIITPSTPQAAGFSAERLKRLDNKLQEFVDSKLVNGGTALIIRNGKVAYHKAFGYYDVEKKVPMRTDHIFRNASQSKAITSVAIMMLVEEGKISLYDPISKFIPEFKDVQVIDKFNLADTTWTTKKASREPNIKDLLTHTSGIGYSNIGSPEANAMYAKHDINAGIGVKGYTLGPMIKRLARLPLFFNPGEKWQYGLNNDVLGYVVEVVSGTTLDKFMKQRIFDPLGMKDTYFYQPTANHKRLTTLYTYDSTGLHPVAETSTLGGLTFHANYPNMDLGIFSGGAGLSGTIYDYGVFLQMLLNGGTYNGKQILSRNTVRMMINHQIGKTPGFGEAGMGLGFGITTLPGDIRSIGTYSWGGAFATTYWVDPKENIVALLYFNMTNIPINGGDTFDMLVYQALAE
jgi:CubicO group peptidase (beta-lactamase class C family)